MLSPDAKRIWKSPAGGALMASMLGMRPMDGGDQATLAALKSLAPGRVKPDDVTESPLPADE